jgi:hypothetical protein
MELKHIDTEIYDLIDAPEGHKERFAIKLLDQQKRQHQKRLWTWTSVAASVSLLIVFGLSYWPNQNSSSSPLSEKTCLNQELNEIEYYYTSLENQRIDQIRSLGIDSSLLNIEVMQLDSIIQNLCYELNAAPDDERIIDIAVQHYTMKLNTLDHILKQLENIKHKNTKQNETINL